MVEDRLVTEFLKLGKYSMGVGDRFAHQAEAQLQACLRAAQHGVEIIPVWNKSNREHTLIGSRPEPRMARSASRCCDPAGFESARRRCARAGPLAPKTQCLAFLPTASGPCDPKI